MGLFWKEVSALEFSAGVIASPWWAVDSRPMIDIGLWGVVLHSVVQQNLMLDLKRENIEKA
jgi:hypothetical protein